jgi:hypothetical protein
MGQSKPVFCSIFFQTAPVKTCKKRLKIFENYVFADNVKALHIIHKIQKRKNRNEKEFFAAGWFAAGFYCGKSRSGL